MWTQTPPRGVRGVQHHEGQAVAHRHLLPSQGRSGRGGQSQIGVIGDSEAVLPTTTLGTYLPSTQRPSCGFRLVSPLPGPSK